MSPGESRPTTTYSIAAAEQDRVHQALLSLGGAQELAGTYERWRIRLSADGVQARAILYTSGKLVLSGRSPAYDQIMATIAPIGKAVPRKANASAARTDPVAPPPETEPHIGTDEAGKGDFFGPMVTAGVFVDARTGQILRTLGVRDSKTVADRQLRGLAADIRRVVEQEKRAVLVLSPKRYNELYLQMRSEGKNLNSMLAWTHTRVIEDLIKAGGRPNYVLSDQFGDKRYIERRLLTDTRLSGVPVLQMHRAEADVAVAAASILARDGFLHWLDQAATALGVTLPKGASPQVIQRGRELVRRLGKEALGDYAKVSFKTMQQVLAP